MKNIVIAAGYATRLGELTKNFPKPLLKIGENTILGRMLDDIDKIQEIDEHIIITNHKFAGIFEEWASKQSYTKPVTIVDDGTKLQRTGVIVLDDNDKVLNMEEKPQEPKSHWAVPPFYIYLKKDLEKVRHSVDNGCGKDAPGNLAHYMVEQVEMHAWKMTAGRFDIGSLDTYKEACEKFGK